MEQDNAIREELNRQLGMFCRSIAAGLRKPKRRLIHQMIYGIQASRDVKVSEIARSLNETIKLLKTEIRLCRNLQDETLTEHINQKLPREAKKKVVNGYSVLEVIGADVYDEHLLPLYSKLYSSSYQRFMKKLNGFFRYRHLNIMLSPMESSDYCLIAVGKTLGLKNLIGIIIASFFCSQR